MPNTVPATSLKELLENINHLVEDYIEAEVARRLEAKSHPTTETRVEQLLQDKPANSAVELPAEPQEYQLINPDEDVTTEVLIKAESSAKTDQMLSEMEAMLQEKIATIPADSVPNLTTVEEMPQVQPTTAPVDMTGMSGMHSLLDRIKQKRQTGVKN